tara:strand:+ start:3902 stop:4087 length:186 start_codon:yes stop_codon:yes gene_type:complete
MKIYFKKKYDKMYRPMEIGDSANVCLQTAEKLVDEGIASYEEIKKRIKTKNKKLKEKENGN